jgi:hypothetical protein
MNLESLKNITGRIETGDSKEKREMFLEKIEKISLVYADKKFQEIKQEKDSYKFSEAIKDFTPIKDIISRPVFHLAGFDLSGNKEKIALFLNDFYNEVDSIYEINGLDLEKISELVEAKKNSIKKYLGVEELRESKDVSSGDGRLKVLEFNKIINIKVDHDGRYKDLENVGFSESDQLVEIHVKDFYDTNEKNFGGDLIKEDLSKVAEYIVDKEPQAVAVVGKSWLMDTPVAGRLGFERVNDGAKRQNDFSAWLQFVDKNGQIDQKRFNKFLETEELPFKSVKGYIRTEEFLKRYLPEDRRGKIILKEADENQKDFWLRAQNEARLIKDGWNDLLKNNGNFESFVRNNKTLNELFDFVDSGSKEEYFSFFQEMYNKKIPWIKFQDYKSENIKEVDKKINIAMENNLYKDKEVFIE